MFISQTDKGGRFIGIVPCIDRFICIIEADRIHFWLMMLESGFRCTRA